MGVVEHKCLYLSFRKVGSRGESFQYVELVNEKGSDNNKIIILNCKILLSLIWSLIVTWDK